jgi:hypothetical protein
VTPAHDTAFTIFQFFLLTFSAYVLQYVVTMSDWPPARWFRRELIAHYGQPSSMVDFWTCPRCFGMVFTIAFFSVLGQPNGTSYVLSIPLIWLQALAAAAIVGLVGSRD